MDLLTERILNPSQRVRGHFFLEDVKSGVRLRGHDEPQRPSRVGLLGQLSCPSPALRPGRMRLAGSKGALLL